MPTLIYPKSRGQIRLASADPNDKPIIDPNFLADPDDKRLLLEGMRMMREVMGGARLKDVVTGELHPGAAIGNSELESILGMRTHTVYHPVGTCRMGSEQDPRSVVGPDLRVLGTSGLRVADASIIPSITGGNTNAPCIMIGERAAELIQGA
jgi:choline dehydrogenase-like flavoprotein